MGPLQGPSSLARQVLFPLAGDLGPCFPPDRLPDHELVRVGVRELLESQPEICVVGEAGTESSALGRIRALRPDVAILDPVTSPDWASAAAMADVGAAGAVLGSFFLNRVTWPGAETPPQMPGRNPAHRPT